MAQHKQHFESLARFGYGAKGVVYILLGALAVGSIFSGFAAQDSAEGALSTLLAAPFGRFLLAGIALGLVAYVLWRLAQSVVNADDHDHDLMGFLTRAGQLFSATANGALALTAGGLALQGSGGGGSGQESIIAMTMQQPFGRWIVGIVGLIFVGAGLGQIYRGIIRDYKDRVLIPASKKPLLDPICQYGLMARGLVFVVIGGLLVYAGFTVSTDEAGGLRDALDWIRSQPYGVFFYAATAIGLAAYGGYCIIQAFYRHIDAPDADDMRDLVPGEK